QAEDGIRDFHVTGVQTCALPICWHKLEKAAIETGAPMPPTHRALDDAQACRHVVLSMAGVATPRRAPTVRVPARPAASPAVAPRSEERRVGKEVRGWLVEREYM